MILLNINSGIASELTGQRKHAFRLSIIKYRSALRRVPNLSSGYRIRCHMREGVWQLEVIFTMSSRVVSKTLTQLPMKHKSISNTIKCLYTRP